MLRATVKGHRPVIERLLKANADPRTADNVGFPAPPAPRRASDLDPLLIHISTRRLFFRNAPALYPRSWTNACLFSPRRLNTRCACSDWDARGAQRGWTCLMEAALQGNLPPQSCCACMHVDADLGRGCTSEPRQRVPHHPVARGRMRPRTTQQGALPRTLSLPTLHLLLASRVSRCLFLT